MHEGEGFSAKNLETSLFNCQNAIQSWSGWPVLKKGKSLPRWQKVQSEKKKRRSMRFLAVSLVFIFWCLFVLRADPRYLSPWKTQANPSDKRVTLLPRMPAWVGLSSD